MNKSIETEVSNYMSFFKKRHIGKGPQDIRVKIVDDTLIYFIYGLMNTMEKKIIESEGGEGVVLNARKMFVESTREERVEEFEKIVGLKVIEHYASWTLDNDSAVGVVVFEDKIN